MSVSEQVAVSIPQKLYTRIRELARQRNRSVDELLVEVLDKSLPEYNKSDPDKEESKIDLEMQAYIDMHPKLKEKYSGQHVAIHNGELVDIDEDYGKLLKRINIIFPDEFVWLATVEEEAIPTLYFRSPRILSDS